MAAYPIMLNLAELRVVVVGGGEVAARKVAGLIAGGARPIVISPAVTQALAALSDTGAITWIARCYAEGDLAGAFLVLAATNDRTVNARVASEARAYGILANIGDNPSEGNCTTTATVRRGDLVLAVTTSGASPTLTATIRRQLETQYGEEYTELLALLRDIRNGPARALPPDRRAALLRQLASDQVLEWVRAGEVAKVWELVEQAGYGNAAPNKNTLYT